MGKKNADEMLFWTKDEFSAFINTLKDLLTSYTMFMTLYYTGMREGELLALTPGELNFDKGTMTINKSYQRLNGKDIVSSPKIPKSNHIVTNPEIWKTALRSYIDKCYGLQPDDRLFPYTKSYLYHEMEYRIEVWREKDSCTRYSSQPRQPIGGDGLLSLADRRASGSRTGADHHGDL